MKSLPPGLFAQSHDAAARGVIADCYEERGDLRVAMAIREQPTRLRARVVTNVLRILEDRKTRRGSLTIETVAILCACGKTTAGHVLKDLHLRGVLRVTPAAGPWPAFYLEAPCAS